MMMTGLAKPSNAFFAGTTPVSTAADSASARDQVVAQPVGDEQDEHPGDDRQRFDLGQGQADGS